LPAVRGIVTSMGLEILEAHEPGELLTHHLAVVARKP
jgi:hypothetical protein